MLEKAVDEVIIPIRNVDLGGGFDEFEHALDAALAARPRTLTLNMVAVDRVSSTTVTMLLWARRRCGGAGADIVLRHPSRRCLETLGRVGLLRDMAVDAGAGPPPSARSVTGPASCGER